MADIPETQKAYFAGFFDGEGCVAIYRKKYVASLSNTDLRPLLAAQNIWGGHIAFVSSASRPAAVRDMWRWQIYGQNSAAFLEDIRPFTSVKSDQIDVYLEIIRIIPTRRGQRRRPGDAEIINFAANRLKSLKWGKELNV